LRAQSMRVTATCGTGWRRQRKHALDPKGHLRRGFSHDNFAVRSRVPWQMDETRIS
jgi:hypothetical protein